MTGPTSVPRTTGPVRSATALANSRGLHTRSSSTDRITWPGMLRDSLKWGAFYSAEAFVLPSHQENFGIAVAEALGCGLPVLISNKVNIWREIQGDGAGLVEDDTQPGTEKLLGRWLAMDAASRLEMSRCARLSFSRRFTIDRMASSLLAAVSGEQG